MLLMLGAMLDVALIAVMLPVASEVSKIMLDKLLDGDLVPVIEVRVCVTEFDCVAVAVTVLCWADAVAANAMASTMEKCMLQGFGARVFRWILLVLSYYCRGFIVEFSAYAGFNLHGTEANDTQRYAAEIALIPRFMRSFCGFEFSIRVSS